MPTATDFSSALGSVGIVPFDGIELSEAPVEQNAPFEQVDFSTPMDTITAAPILAEPYGVTQHPFSLTIDAIGVTLNDQLGIGASHEGFDPVPLVYRMRGFSTLLDQYVTWQSVGNTFTPPPTEYGTVIKVTSELVT